MKRILFPLLLVAAAAGLAVTPTMIVNAPTEPTMGFVQRIFYWHVPCAWLTFLSVFVCAVGAGAYLFKRSRPGDALAVAAAELSVVFGALVLITGPLWGRKAWGVWWVWKDVRLMTTLLLWFVFVAYLLVRRFGGPTAARLSAGFAVFGAATVPIIYTSVFFWRTQHPKATVVNTLDPAMLPPFLISLLVFTIFYIVLLWMRYALERGRQKLEDAYLEADDAGLIEESR